LIYNKKSLLFTITIAVLFSTQIILSDQSFAQIQSNPNVSENNTTTTISPSSNTTNQNPQSKNNTLFDPTVYRSFSDNFASTNGTNGWSNVSGNWIPSENGLHAGKSDNTTSKVNNRDISPVAAKTPFSVNTSFTINNLNEDVVSSVYMIYGITDPQNYQQAGITIYKDDVYVRVADVVNGSLSSPDPGLGTKTNLIYKPGSLFNMSLSVDNAKQQLILNGSSYTRDLDNSNLDGYVGLKYGRIIDMDFHDFHVLPGTNLANLIR
jgi:hypothetical protein